MQTVEIKNLLTHIEKISHATKSSVLASEVITGHLEAIAGQTLVCPESLEIVAKNTRVVQEANHQTADALERALVSVGKILDDVLESEKEVAALSIKLASFTEA